MEAGGTYPSLLVEGDGKGGDHRKARNSGLPEKVCEEERVKPSPQMTLCNRTAKGCGLSTSRRERDSQLLSGVAALSPQTRT